MSLSGESVNIIFYKTDAVAISFCSSGNWGFWSIYYDLIELQSTFSVAKLSLLTIELVDYLNTEVAEELPHCFEFNVLIILRLFYCKPN